MAEREEVALSLVIPVLNEESSLRALHAEIVAIADQVPQPLEILFIDDGSTDESWSRIEELHAQDDRVSGLRFRRNFGKAAALQAGFAETTGRRVITMDADLQDDPREIPRLLAMLDQNCDVVSGWKRVRHDPWHKVLPSRVFNAMVRRLTGVGLHDVNCGLKAYRREVLDEIEIYGEFHRFTPILAAARGFRIGEIQVNHRARLHGKSKYNWRRFISGMIDLLTVKFLTSYQHRPQHLLGIVGLTAMAAGMLGLTYLSIVWIFNALSAIDNPIGTRPLLIFSVTAFLGGLQIFSVGLIAELITFRAERHTELFSVVNQVGKTGGMNPKPESRDA